MAVHRRPPKWAIAVIVVLGFLALVAFGILAFDITRRLHQRRSTPWAPPNR